MFGVFILLLLAIAFGIFIIIQICEWGGWKDGSYY